MTLILGGFGSERQIQGTLSWEGTGYRVSGSLYRFSSTNSVLQMTGDNGLLAPDCVTLIGTLSLPQDKPPAQLSIQVGLASSSVGLPLRHYSGTLLFSPAPDIRHVFVVMLENRSFDHMFGMQELSGTDPAGNATHINGLQPLPANFQNSYPPGTPYLPKPTAADPMTSDPGHEFPDALQQLCGPKGLTNPFPLGPYPAIDNSGFAANYATTHSEGDPPDPSHRGDTIRCCSPDQIPVLSALAREFAICDNWFASVPGPTWPNRLFAMGASSGGMDRSPSNDDLRHFAVFGFAAYPNGSFFSRLTASSVQWRVYNDNTNAYAGVAPTIFGSYAIAYLLKGMSTPRSLTRFGDDLKGDYPYAFTWIEPNYGDAEGKTYIGGSSQHPKDGLIAGERLVFDVYNKIRNSPLWPNSLLIITYDEHGGFYDHVAPPTAPPPGDGAVGGTYSSYQFNFTQYGVRVPAILVSPRIKRNTIDHTVYDHASILQTVEDLFQMQPLTIRDTVANSLTHLLSGPVRTDLAPIPAPAAAATPAQAHVGPRADDLEPLPNTGNVWGFLMMVAKKDFEMSAGTEVERQAIAARLQSIKTRGDARAYAEEVEQRKAVFEKRAMP